HEQPIWPEQASMASHWIVRSSFLHRLPAAVSSAPMASNTPLWLEAAAAGWTTLPNCRVAYMRANRGISPFLSYWRVTCAMDTTFSSSPHRGGEVLTLRRIRSLEADSRPDTLDRAQAQPTPPDGCAVLPPSITRVCPVIHDEASEARNSA